MSKKGNQYLAEMMGTFALVFTGSGAMIVNDITTGSVTNVGVALVFGLIVTAMIYSIGNISGAHINPAVTLGFVLARKFAFSHALFFIFFQFIGACLASFCLRMIFPTASDLGCTLIRETWQQAFVLEVVLTFNLMFVILNVSTGSKEKGLMAGVAVGATVALSSLFAGPICGASMNPARSFAPALLSWNFSDLWVYMMAPVLGAFLAVPFCRWIQGVNCCQTEEGDEDGK